MALLTPWTTELAFCCSTTSSEGYAGYLYRSGRNLSTWNAYLIHSNEASGVQNICHILRRTIHADVPVFNSQAGLTHSDCIGQTKRIIASNMLKAPSSQKLKSMQVKEFSALIWCVSLHDPLSIQGRPFPPMSDCLPDIETYSTSNTPEKLTNSIILSHTRPHGFFLDLWNWLTDNS